jgi:flagellar basal-body rod protein FlgC
VQEDPTPFRQVHDPGHPDADPKTGMVAMPNVNVVEEMVNMISSARSYEANVTAFETLKQLVNKAMEIGR